MWLKACPRCHGDLFIEYLPDGEEITCLQCGHHLPTAMTAKLVARTSRRRARRGATAHTASAHHVA
ncbi:MAG: hypothetical protein HY689_11245 [Chloroflexi bacterium]|nr:hypothetical protein [Chloroflexota bacterium]